MRNMSLSHIKTGTTFKSDLASRGMCLTRFNREETRVWLFASGSNVTRETPCGDLDCSTPRKKNAQEATASESERTGPGRSEVNCAGILSAAL